MRRKALIAFLLLADATLAQASKLELNYGFFSVSSEASGTSSTVSGPGALQLNYAHHLVGPIELTFGYTILVAGDFANGFDVGARWFPITATEAVAWSQNGTTYTVSESWRPFLGVAFSQRQFQSARQGYSGFGFDIGVEHPVSDSFLLRASARYRRLSGSSTSRATEIDLLLGIGLNF